MIPFIILVIVNILMIIAFIYILTKLYKYWKYKQSMWSIGTIITILFFILIALPSYIMLYDFLVWKNTQDSSIQSKEGEIKKETKMLIPKKPEEVKLSIGESFKDFYANYPKAKIKRVGDDK